MKNIRLVTVLTRSPNRFPPISLHQKSLVTRVNRQRISSPFRMASTSSDSVPSCSPLSETCTKLTSAEDSPLPKLTPAEFRQYNRMAEHMDYFHNHFRSTWNTLYSACESQKRPKGMSIKQFLALGQQFCHHLEMHHGIEEQHIFPVLAKKMPAFKKELELLTQHKQIHKGLDKLEKYLNECGDGERELRLGELKVILDGFGEVLWQHLDDEVGQLGAENMRKYWTLEDMRRMPM